ncbi:hypothetical protein DESC_100068 [Desulfosarcina cetonica]|nr:hypothetical protein DESC_100068 [Desulfosarcina cetonica]
MNDGLVESFLHLRNHQSPFVDRHGKRAGLVHEGFHGAGLLNDMMIHTLVGRQAHTGILHVLHHVHGHGLLQERIHSRQKRYSQIHLGKAEKTPVRAHETEIEGAAQDCPPGKGMTGNSGHGDQRIGSQALEQSIELVKKGFGAGQVVLLDHRNHPLQVDAIGEDFLMGGGHYQGGCIRGVFDLVERIQESIEKIGIESVFTIVQGHCGHVRVNNEINPFHLPLLYLPK